MAEIKRGLGKGLSELLSLTDKPDAPDSLVDIKHIKPNRFQPRRVFDEAALHELAESIRAHGVLQPVLVRQVVDGYELVAGERRWRAAQIAGLNEIPVIIKQYNDRDMLEIAVIENVQRENFNPLEEAQAYQRLIDECGYTQEEIASRVSKSRSSIANFCRLLQLPGEIKNMLANGMVTPGHANAILRLKKLEDQLILAYKIDAEKLSVRQAEELVKRMLLHPLGVVHVPPPVKSIYVVDFEQRLEQQFGTRVRISGKANGSGKIEIEYASDEDLGRIIEELSQKRERFTVSSGKKGFVV